MDKSKNPPSRNKVGDASNSIADKQLREAILDILYDKYQLESESESVDWFKLKQALNLYIEEKEKEAQLEVLMGFRKRDFVREDFYRVAVTDRIKELNGTPPDQITDEDIKKGWPKV